MTAVTIPLTTRSNIKHEWRASPEPCPGRAACPDTRWRVVEATESRLVDVAARRVAELAYPAYTPLFPVWMRVNQAGAKQPSSWHWRPRFFQFFFVQFGPTDPWGEIIHQPSRFGIRRILGMPGQTPNAVPDQLIDWLRIDEARRAAEIEAEERRKSRLTPFKPGALVMVKTTPIGLDEFGADRYHYLAGQVLTVESCNGRTTSGFVTLFNRRVPAQFARSELSDE